MAAVLVFNGCSKQEPPPQLSVTEAQKKFEEKCLKDYNLHVRTRQVGHTFWVYLPTKDPIFDYEVQKKQDGEAKKAKKFSVNFLNGTFQNDVFSLEYDIIDKKKEPTDDYGFNSSYTDSYQKVQNNIFTAIYEIFFNTAATPGQKSVNFFVIIITDIQKGIETRLTFYLEDFIRYMSGSIPYEEYLKRFLPDQKGSPAMIGDETGTHIEYIDILMGDFLAKQILNRIRFKLQHSDFAPEDKYDDTIIGIVADTLRYYRYEDFTNVRLNNLRLDKKYLFNKAQLVNFGEDKPEESKGKLIHIRFKDGKPEFMDENSLQSEQ